MSLLISVRQFIVSYLGVQELDFLNEGKNCEKSLENFKRLSPKLASQISVPHIYWELSTQRILSMEFMDGVGVTDVQAIKALGLHPADVARLVRFNSYTHESVLLVLVLLIFLLCFVFV